MGKPIAVALAALAFAVAVRADHTPAAHRSADLIGMEVRNTRNESVGVIHDLVIDTQNGQVVYAALAHGGTLGFGAKLFAVPLTAFRYNAESKTLTLQTERPDFEAAQGFDANMWPTQADGRWLNNKEAREARPQEPRADAANHRARLRRISSLVGLSVKNTRNEDLGRVYDLPIDLAQGNVAYVALHYGGTLGVGGKLFAVPWQAMELKSLTLKPSVVSFVVDADKNYFDTNPGFDTKNWPNRPAQIGKNRTDTGKN